MQNKKLHQGLYGFLLTPSWLSVPENFAQSTLVPAVWELKH
jgi:hypothetical protein